jgi:hypothetical protein
MDRSVLLQQGKKGGGGVMDSQKMFPLNRQPMTPLI